MHRLATLLLALALPLAASAQTWTPQTSGTSAELSDVFFLDASTGFAVGDAGLLLSTTNGGQTWASQVLLGGALDLEGLAFNPSGTIGLIVTDDGPVLRSTDAGGSWTLIATGAGDLRDLAWAGETTVWVAGRDGDSALSTDGGQTWTYHNTGSAERTESIAAVSATEAWIGNREGELRHTTDGGQTWAPQTSGSSDDIDDLQMLDALTGYAASGDGVLKTTNGGATWTRASGGDAEGEGLFFLDASTGWVVGDLGEIRFTDDGAATWTLQPSGVTAELSAVHFPTAEAGWAVGAGGTILRFGGGGPTASEPGEAPAAFALEPAYPNPFNPSTRLRFSLDAAGPARLAVYDALGREVAVLVDGSLAAGAHEAAFAADGLPSGLYLARLTAGAQTRTRTLTLLR